MFFLLHKKKVILLIALMLICLCVTAWLGDAKNWQEIDWLDVIGEGGSAVAMIIWIAFILGSRPNGRVTNLLTIGLGFMMIAFWQDALDEFIRLPAGEWWDQWFESITMPLGISVLTYGLYHWYQEQMIVNDTLKKREQFFREHLWFDNITHINRSDQLKKQVAIIADTQPHEVLSIIMLDVAKFSGFNRSYGRKEGDGFLYKLSEFIQLNMRDQDLLTRYAADRFALILPCTSADQAQIIAQQLKVVTEHFHYYLEGSDMSFTPILNIGVASCKGMHSQELISKGNQALALAKQPIKVA